MSLRKRSQTRVFKWEGGQLVEQTKAQERGRTLFIEVPLPGTPAEVDAAIARARAAEVTTITLTEG